jgi:site-specific DNA-cytosine methylase
MARSVNGLPRELVDARNAGLGNAVVPQVAEWIGRQIIESLP